MFDLMDESDFGPTLIDQFRYNVGRGNLPWVPRGRRLRPKTPRYD
jgi:hypothetical protein